MKNVYLTFDIETIVSRFSSNSNYLVSVYAGALSIAYELKKKGLKGTFFISLSSKQKNIDQKEYSKMIENLLFNLHAFDNIKVEAHIHAYNLPMSFDCKFDGFNKYTYNQKVDLLNYAKKFFYDNGYQISSFRPGGFSFDDSYYDALREASYNYSSILEKKEKATINLASGEINANHPYLTSSGVLEYPLTSVEIFSIKGQKEIVNLSPDFFNLSSISNEIDKLDYINMNFHSFSVFTNRFIRENHDHQFLNNIKFLFLERPLSKLLCSFSVETYSQNTILNDNFTQWMTFFSHDAFESKFIGE